MCINLHCLLRVGSKMSRSKNRISNAFPVLLAKTSHLTKLIVLGAHQRLFHAGVYSVLTDLRWIFWIPNYFSVKNILKVCIHCRRFNARTVKLNQSFY